MKKSVKFMLAFVLMIGISVTSISAATKIIPHDGKAYQLTGASGTAQDYVSGDLYCYWTQGTVTSWGYYVSAYVRGSGGTILASVSMGPGSSTKSAQYYRRTSQGHISHDHMISSNPAAK